MSILPTQQTQGYASSSTQPQPLSQKPNPSHGNSGHHLRHNRHSPRPRPLSPLIDPSPGPVDPGSEDSGGSSQKVTGLGDSNGKRNGSSQTKWRMSGANAAPRSQQGTGSLDGPGSSPGIGARKSHMISGNHLLNFQYDPISRPQYRPPPPPRRQQKIRPYKKDLFLQANYKFVVLDSGNDELDSLDPDKMLQWEDILCVRHYTAFSVQCPICLEYPLCPQITSCGHIFCFPCILQYLLMGDVDQKGETFKRCPLCFVMISQRELCAVQIEMVKRYSVGDTIDFMLLTRRKDSYVLTEKNNEENHSIACNNVTSSLFSKFTFTTDVDLSVREAMADLDGWLAKADSGLVDDMEKLPYVSAALDELEKRKKYWNEQRVLNGSKASKCANSVSESCSPPPIGFTGLERVKHNVRNDLPEAVSGEKFIAKSKLEESEEAFTWDQTASISHSPEEKSVELSSSCEECKYLEGHMSRFTDIKYHDSYNFYQAVDGQNIILHPLTMKCLLHHWGSYNLLPNRLSGRILQLETVTQTESIRRRYRYLSHFSLTTAFLLCEIDINELLPGDALLPFKDEIKKRESERKRIAEKERKEKLKAEATAEIPMSIQFDMGQPSSFGSPTFSMDDFEALGQPNVLSTSPPVVGERKTFSNVTRLGFAAGHDSPSLKREGVDSVDQTTSKGTTHLNVPSFANMISKAKPVDSLGMANKGNEMAKKGKKSSQVLLSTAGGRRY